MQTDGSILRIGAGTGVTYQKMGPTRTIRVIEKSLKPVTLRLKIKLVHGDAANLLNLLNKTNKLR